MSIFSTTEQKLSPTQNLLIEILLRLFAGGAIAYFAYGVALNWLNDPHRYSLIPLIVSESLTTFLLLIARSPIVRDWRPISIITANVATFYFLFLSLDDGLHLIPESIGASIQTVGVFWQIYSKISLGRSFGLLPARRGVVKTGAYRFVRHPIYLGYLIAHIGFLLTNFNLQNLLTLTALYLTQTLRLLKEEELLKQDVEYQLYCNTVRFRVLPGIF